MAIRLKRELKDVSREGEEGVSERCATGKEIERENERRNSCVSEKNKSYLS